MAVKFLFEDSPTSPSSRLLNAHTFNKGNFYFSGGSDGLLRYLRSNWDEHNTFVVFVDLVPNNKATRYTWQVLVRECSLYENVIVLPILCMEYLLLQLVRSLSIGDYPVREQEELELLLFEKDGGVVPSSVVDRLHNESLERVCKRILSHHRYPCFRNKTKVSSNVYGKFYQENCGNCNTDIFKCKFSLELDLLEKAERLYTLLPLFDVVSAEHEGYLRSLGLNTVSSSVNEAIDKCQVFYDCLCDTFEFTPVVL